ncbi:MAG: polyprenyl synthetase [Ignavibacteria bacterium GWF2_33_9]|nr:MAG: polyprenyl synthetase [Ignavibacteria bacterium GWF2_33_9]
MKLDKIIEPVKGNLAEFDEYYNSQFQSKIPLLNMILKYMARRGGKKIRPSLVFLTANLFGEITKRAYTGAAMIELLHTATLVHDDVVDNANERRGFLSINAIWKNKIAVLIGDFLLSKGLLIAVETNEFEFLKVTSSSVQKMSEGELLSMESSRKMKYSEELYYEITKGKTAVLLRACCEIGAIAQKQPQEVIEKMGEFGELLGMAFQIIDDVFDYTKSNYLIGKPVGNDIKEKKITLPLLMAFRNAQKSEIESIIKKIKNGKLNKKEVTDIIEFVKEKSGVEAAKLKAEEYIQNAIEILKEFENVQAKETLIDFANFIIQRDK